MANSSSRGTCADGKGGQTRPKDDTPIDIGVFEGEDGEEGDEKPLYLANKKNAAPGAPRLW